MKRFLSIRSMIFTIALLLGAMPVTAVGRPFALNGNGLATFVTDGAGNIIGADVTASGTATHLGLFTSVGRLVFTPDPNNPNIIHPSGEATITAANGDKLTFVLENGELDVTTGVAHGTFRFTGGTGRFEGASGSAASVVTQNLATGAFQLTAVGSINY